LDDVKFLLIGPIWLLHFVCKKIGLKYWLNYHLTLI
jgi:hypothetical protein